MNIDEHLIMVWIIAIEVLILIGFTLSTLINYFRNKKHAGLYLSLNYISFAVAMVFHLVGHYDSVISGTTTDFYDDASMYGKIFIVLGILFILLFHGQFVKVNKVWKYIRIFFGVLLMIWLLLPTNYNYGGRSTVITTYMLMALYGLAINLFLAISFFKMARRTVDRRMELNSLGLGALGFLVYYFLMTIYGMTQSFLLMIITQAVLFLALFFYFIGIYLPKLKSKKS
jgi:hypothetical protein